MTTLPSKTDGCKAVRPIHPFVLLVTTSQGARIDVVHARSIEMAASIAKAVDRRIQTVRPASPSEMKMLNGALTGAVRKVTVCPMTDGLIVPLDLAPEVEMVTNQVRTTELDIDVSWWGAIVQALNIIAATRTARSGIVLPRVHGVMPADSDSLLDATFDLVRLANARTDVLQSKLSFSGLPAALADATSEPAVRALLFPSKEQ